MFKMVEKYLNGAAFQAPDAPSGGSASTSPSGGGGDQPSAGSSSSASSTPSASPSPAPASSPSESTPTPSSGSGDSGPSADSGIDFDVFFGGVEPPESAPPATPQPAPVESQPAPAPAAQPAPAQPAPAAAPQPGAPSPSGGPPESAPAPLDPTDPVSLLRGLRENETPMIEHIAKNMFAITPQEMEELETNVGEAIPKLLGKVFVKAQAAMLHQLQNVVPAMMQRQTQVMQRNAANQAKFYARWPQLKADQHGEIVQRLAVQYRQQNPTATFDQMVEQLGPYVMMAAGIQPGAPTAPQPSKPQPFVPATPGATAVAPPTPVDEFGWETALDPNRAPPE